MMVSQVSNTFAPNTNLRIEFELFFHVSITNVRTFLNIYLSFSHPSSIAASAVVTDAHHHRRASAAVDERSIGINKHNHRHHHHHAMAAVPAMDE